MRRIHRLGAATAAALALLVGPAIAATPESAEVLDDVVLDPALEAQLASADADEMLTLIAHGTSFDAVTSAVEGHGMAGLADFPLIDAVATAGTPAQVSALATASEITHLEADVPLEYFGDTSHRATRGAELVEGYQVAVDDDEGPSGKAKGHDKDNARGEAAGQQQTTTQVQASGAGISIAVIDSGVDGTHPMFTDHDAVDENGEPTGASRVVVNRKFAPLIEASAEVPGNDTDTISAGGHGTHVAGIAAGGPFQIGDQTDGGRTITGAAPEAKIVSLSAGSGISISSALQAQYWVLDNHRNPCGLEGGADASCPPIRVVNNSYGPLGGGEFDESSATVKIQRLLAQQGVLMVWAAGNDGGGGADNRSNPPGQDPTPGVLMVANYDDDDAGDRDGSLSSSSSRGDASRRSTWPDLSAPGTDITSACRVTLVICSSGEGDAGTISGTSMAAPHVAGIVAQLLELVPDATAAHVENTLEDTAHQFTSGGAYYQDHRNPDHTSSFDKGHGLVDAVAAANELLGLIEAPDVSNQPACDATDVLIRDPEGDGFVSDAILVDPGIGPSEQPESDPTVDLLAVDAVEVDGGLDVIFDLGAYTGAPPEGKDGYRMHLQADLGGETYYIAMSFSSDPTLEDPRDFGIDVLDESVYSEIIDLDGHTDPDTGTVTVEVRNQAIREYNNEETRTRPEVPILGQGSQLTDLAALTQTATGIRVSTLAEADTAAGQCAFEYGTGAITPDPPIDQPNDSGVDEDGNPIAEGPITVDPLAGQTTLTAGGDDSFEGTPPTTTANYSCQDVHDDVCPTYLVRVDDAGTLTVSVEARTPAEDLDVLVYDDRGAEIAIFGAPGTPPGGLEGGDVEVEPGAYFVQVQPYLVEGSDLGLTGGTAYTLDVALS